MGISRNSCTAAAIHYLVDKFSLSGATFLKVSLYSSDSKLWKPIPPHSRQKNMIMTQKLEIVRKKSN